VTTPRACAIAAFALAGLLACAATTRAHSGGLDKHGCHSHRKTGEYHCHRGAAPARATRAAPAPDPRPAPSRLHDGAPTRAFRNCDEARAHGAAPVRRGNPGYGPHLDRDNDGVGCEPYRGR
jgi:hypothetical protein